jgi:hypothetical protein
LFFVKELGLQTVADMDTILKTFNDVRFKVDKDDNLLLHVRSLLLLQRLFNRPTSKPTITKCHI